MMGEGSGFLEIILLAMVAAFIFLRLRNVLGRRTGHEQSNPRTRLGQGKDAEDSKASHDEDNVIALPDRESQTAPNDDSTDDSPPLWQQGDRDQQREHDQRGQWTEAVDALTEHDRGDEQRTERNPVDLIEIEPEEQRVAADERAEQ